MIIGILGTAGIALAVVVLYDRVLRSKLFTQEI
jgi:hypothetical protein